MDETEESLYKWKIKNLIKKMNESKGDGTSMISLIIPKGSQPGQISGMLTQEYSTSNNIRSHINKLSVQMAIRSAQEKLKLYSKIPPCGLCIYVGTALVDNKERKVSYDFEPFKPINTFLYRCDNKFHTEPLEALLDDDEIFGFIIVDGSKCTYAKISGNNREICKEFTVELPKKHNKGGQSSNRYARLRTEKRHNYLRKVAENAVPVYITNNIPNVSGLIIAGSALLKKEIVSDDLFDGRLKKIILSIIDINYGGESGLNQAISLAGDVLKNTKFIREKKLLNNYYEQISKNNGLICYGIHDTMFALTWNMIEKLIIWENLDFYRIEIQKDSDNSKEIKYMTKDNILKLNEKILSEQLLTEYLAENIKELKIVIEFITDKTPEGSQFVKGFGGIGALLISKMDFFGDDNDNDDDVDDDFI